MLNVSELSYLHFNSNKSESGGSVEWNAEMIFAVYKEINWMFVQTKIVIIAVTWKNEVLFVSKSQSKCSPY